MTPGDVIQYGLGAGGVGGGAWALVKALVALKPLLHSNGNGNTSVLQHLDKQYDVLQRIAGDIHVSTEQLRDFVHESREYQREGRAAMLRIEDLHRSTLDKHA